MLKFLELFMHGVLPKLLIFEEKHGTQYIVTRNVNELSIALLSVVEERIKDGWYMDELYGDDLPKDGVDSNQISMFSQDNIVPKTDKQRAQDIVDLARSGAEDALIDAGALACDFLRGRSDHEYERFTVEYLSDPTFSLTPEK